MAVTVTHSKTLVSPDSGVEDKVYGADYVSATSHTLNGLGTGVETALGVNIGSAGGVITFNGDAGTPSALVGTNITGTAAGLTAGAVTNGVYTTNNLSVMAATTSAQLAGVISDETGSGALVFATSPTLVTPNIGVASATSLATSAATPLLLTNGQLVNIALTGQTVGATTLTIPDFASVVDEFTFKTKAQTMSNKTFVAPALGTPASGVLTNCTGLPTAGLVDDAVTYAKIQNVTTARLLGRATAGSGDTEEITLGTNLSFTGTTLNAASGSGATLDGITAATADQAGISNGDFNVRWNWAKTTNSEVAMEFGESAASTGGTSTSGVPNQVIAKFSTVAASTASPLSVYSRALHVFSVSPTSRQILSTNGTQALPAYSFSAGTGSGFWAPESQDVSLSVNGTHTVRWIPGRMLLPSGTAASPPFTEKDIAATSGIFWPIGASVGIAVSAIENSRFIAGELQFSKGSADTVAYSLSARKSRGTVAAPTVITTGDDLLDINAYGYVGATNTYQLAASISFDSTGAISDSATGIGGIIRFKVATVGGEPAEVFNITGTTLILSGPVRLKGYTVAGLPAGTQGDCAFVTDALAPTYLAAVVGGGAVVTEVFYDGTNWVCT